MRERASQAPAPRRATESHQLLLGAGPRASSGLARWRGAALCWRCSQTEGLVPRIDTRTIRLKKCKGGRLT